MVFKKINLMAISILALCSFCCIVLINAQSDEDYEQAQLASLDEAYLNQAIRESEKSEELARALRESEAELKSEQEVSALEDRALARALLRSQQPNSEAKEREDEAIARALQELDLQGEPEHKSTKREKLLREELRQLFDTLKNVPVGGFFEVINRVLQDTDEDFKQKLIEKVRELNDEAELERAKRESLSN